MLDVIGDTSQVAVIDREKPASLTTWPIAGGPHPHTVTLDAAHPIEESKLLVYHVVPRAVHLTPRPAIEFSPLVGHIARDLSNCDRKHVLVAQ